MKKLLVAVALVAAPLALAQRADVYDWAAQRPFARVATIADLEDGGCCRMVEFCAAIYTVDASTKLDGCDRFNRELRGIPKGDARGLLNFGERHWAARQRIGQSDAGGELPAPLDGGD